MLEYQLINLLWRIAVNNTLGLNKRLIETVSFNQFNFVKSYDKNIFLKKATTVTTIDNQQVKIKVAQTTEPTLKDYSILSIRNGSKKIKMIIKSSDVFAPPKNMTNQIWMQIFMNFNETNQAVGKQVSEAISKLEREATLFEPENVRTEIRNQFLQAQASQKADQIAAEFFTRTANLEDEMEHCGLSKDNIAMIKRYSAGASDISEFLAHSALVKIPKEATIIGLNHKEIIHGVRETLVCQDYMDAYDRIFNDFRARDDFLEKLTQERRPIIFLVPHKLFGPKKGVTAREMEWLLRNPKEMANVHFVFRAYKTYSAKMLSSTGLKDKKDITYYQEQMTTRIFKQIQAKMRLSKPREYDPDQLMSQFAMDKKQFELLRPKPFGEMPKLSQLSLADEVE